MLFKLHKTAYYVWNLSFKKLNLDAFDSSVPNFRDRQHMLGVFLHGV